MLLVLALLPGAGCGGRGQPPGLDALRHGEARDGFEAFVELSTLESEAFRRGLLEAPQEGGPPPARLVAAAVERFRQSVLPRQDAGPAVRRFRLAPGEIVERLAARRGPIDGEAVYGAFAGRWHGVWDGRAVEHHWGAWQPQSPPRRIAVPGGDAVRLRGWQYAWVGDGYALNHVVRTPDGGDALLGYVVHVEGGDLRNEVVRRPHAGVSAGPGRVVWITAREVFLEESRGDSYTICGFAYRLENGVLHADRAFLATYTRPERDRRPWVSWPLEIEVRPQELETRPATPLAEG